MPAQLIVQHSKQCLLQNLRNLTSDFFYQGMEWPAFESTNGQNSTVISESKFLDTMQTLLTYFG